MKIPNAIPTTKKNYPIVGMHCSSCAKLIERKLSKVDGVKKATVNYANESAMVELVCDVDDSIIEDAVISAGYKVGRNLEEEKKKELKNLKIKLIFSSISAIIVMFLGFYTFNFSNYLSFLLALIVQIWVGSGFYKATYSGLKNLTTSMDTLVVIGTSSAFLYSTFSMFNNSPTYFDTSVTIITLVLLGRFLEMNAKGRMTESIKNLLLLEAKSAVVIRNGNEITIPIDELLINDLVRVKPGEKVATDGIVVEGYSFVDESMVTGEPSPNYKKNDDVVIGGTINKNGTFVFKVTKIGKDTLLSQIVKMVQEAQGSKAEIQKMVDLVSSYFIPAILVISIFTFLFFGIPNAIAVLVIACPCAMGLATPTAIIVGIGRGAKLGILIKDIQALEILSKVKTIIFDKTGTLTQGHPVLAKYVGKTGTYEENLQIAASLESNSSHPIAEAIVGDYKLKIKNYKLLKVVHFRNLEGKGVEGTINGTKYFLGKSKDASISLIQNKKILASFVVEDRLKPDVNETIKSLESRGITTWMITGDSKKNADIIAHEAGIKNILSEVLPQDKAKKVNDLRNEKFTNTVAFVGDGVNDAPALAVADVGIAMGTGTDVAIESSGITLLNKDFGSVITTYNLSRATMLVIKQNLLFSFGYNSILIPVAMFGLLNPMIAAGAMSISSISVVLNSLRLNKIRI
jgi:Cu+-exporting ATPase